MCIDDHASFLADFAEVDGDFIWSPSAVSDNSTVIKITYFDGEYELIKSHGQSKFKNGYYDHYAGSFVFDSTEFNALMQKYTAIESSLSDKNP